MMLRQVLPVVPTPFGPGGEADAEAIGKLARHAVDAGAGGIVFPGVASEDLHLSAHERRACLSAAVGAVEGRLPVVAGVNDPNPTAMVAMAESAAECGANAIMAMAVPAMGSDAARWFGRIAEATEGLPIVLQNLDAPRGAGLSADQMLHLARQIPAVRYVKEEGVPSGPKVTALVGGVGADLDGVIGGAGGRYLFEELERGAIATMPAFELLELHVAIVSAHRAGRRAEALALYERSLPLLLIQAPYRMRLTKLILTHCGLMDRETVREPLPEIDEPLRRLAIEFYERLQGMNLGWPHPADGQADASPASVVV